MMYKKGDRVRIVSEPPEGLKGLNWNDEMDKYLGKVMTIKRVLNILTDSYKMVEDENDGDWFWDDNMIAGLASEVPFDFGAWKDKNVCMRCRSREEARDFRCEMEKAGLRWNGGDSYLDKSCFNHYEDLTCYYFNEGAYDSAEYAKNRGDQILEWSKYRSTEPPKEEQEKTMSKSNDKPLNYQEVTSIYKRLCEHQHKKDSCRECPVSSSKNYTKKLCRDFLIENTDKAEPILKQWAAEHPVKTNWDKLIEVFGEIQKYDDKCKNHCSTIPCQSCNWWRQEYVEPYKVKE